MTRRARRGFTLLEVMVSMAILGICLTAVFSTEAGAVRMATRARKMGLATLLARCKMGEIEEDISVNGLPALFATGSDECCEDAEIDGFSCKWELEPIVMPETMFSDEGDAAGLLEGAQPPPTAAPTPDPAAPPGAPPTDMASGGPSELLSGGGDVDAMAALAMQYVYPVLKPAFESQIRRATVTVTWHEGAAERSFDVTQYVVAETGAVSEAPQDGEQTPGQEPQPQGTGTQGAEP